MKDSLKRIALYFIIGLVFCFIAVELQLHTNKVIGRIIISSMVIAVVGFITEKIMYYLYTRANIPRALRQILTVVFATLIFAFVLYRIFPLVVLRFFARPAVLIFVILPIFTIFSFVFESVFRKEEKEVNDRLKEIQSND